MAAQQLKTKQRLSDAFIAELLDRVDIVRLIDNRLGGKLKKKGGNYECPCPFHEENTASFVVSEQKQIFTCFGGCFGGKGSNALNFIREYDKVGFPEAVEILCDEVGMAHPFGKEENLDPLAEKKQNVLKALSDAAELYQGFLKDPKYQAEAVQYLKGRGITGEVAKKYGLGVAPKEWAILQKKLTRKHGQQTLIDAGLISKKGEKAFDMFRDRIMFPISDQRGRIVGFGGRRLDDSSNAPKYINSPETIVFVKNKELYNFDNAQNAARKAGNLYIVEGYTDVIAHGQFGIENTAAPLGTAFTTAQLAKVLSVTTDPVMCFDGDRAGREAAWKSMMMALPSLADGVRMKFLFYPEGQDPDTLLRSEGADAYMARLNAAMPLSEFVVVELKRRYNDGSPESAAAIAHGAADVIAAMPAGVYREVMLSATAQAIGLPEQRLLEAMQKQHPNAKVTLAHPTGSRPNPTPVMVPARTPAPTPEATPAQSQSVAAPNARAAAPQRPSAVAPAGNHFTGGSTIPGMTLPMVAPGPQQSQFLRRNERAIDELRSTGNIESFTRACVGGELRHSKGALNSRYLADNVTAAITDLVGKAAVKSVAPKIRNYTMTATSEYNRRLAEYEKTSQAPSNTPSRSPSSGMGVGS